MYYTTVLSLVFLLTAKSQPQVGPLGSNRFSGKSTYGLTISARNGNTTVVAMIAGKRYTATYPESTTIYTNTFVRRQEGRFNQVLQITVNDKSYTYKTVEGNTTVFDGDGKELRNGGPFGPFHVTSTAKT
ncbi:hypothetical protein GCK32_013465 [Trichostrongylus colubriformis]|uniref:Uncharacterized protein n=1 Tax=Trichostrongylus colubriformis TaxID=6319 RepID=A0AAN8FYQ0_TRICO